MNCLSGDTIDVSIFWNCRPGLLVGTDEQRERALLRRRVFGVLGHHEQGVGLVDGRDVVLRPGDPPPRGGAPRGGGDVVAVGAGVGLGEAEGHLPEPSAMRGSHSRFMSSEP